MIKSWKDLTNDDKLNELRKIAELRGVGYSWDEIGDFYGISPRTIRDYYDNHKIRKSAEIADSIINGNSSKIEITADLLVDLLDRMNDMEAKFKSLEADVIKASKVHCNELKSDKKYIVKRLSTREFIAYADEDELGRYIKAFGGRIPIATIDNSINERSNWICRMDDVLVEYTTENIIDNVDYKSKLLQNKHDSLEQALNKMMDLQ